MMKKIAVALLAVVLLLALAVPALADTMYTTKKVKVYEEPSTRSRVTLTLKAAHEVEVYNYVDGFYECKYGWIQEKYLSREYPQSKCHHNWTRWETVRKATCTKGGYKRRYCTKCGIVEEKDIAKAGHEWGKWKVTKEATCVKEGTRKRTCARCGEEQKENYLADHEYGKWTVVKEATCTEKGSRQHACVVCGHKEQKAVDKLPHDFEYRIIKEATDHSSGMRASVCRVCGYTEAAKSYDPEGTLRRKDRGEEVRQLQGLLVDQGYLNVGGADGIYGGGTEKAIMKFQADQGLTPDGIAWPQTQQRLSHDFGEWETVRPMTRTTPGLRQRTCKECGYIQTETIEAGDVIERGSRGENVRVLQQILKQVGYDAGGFDGIYGQKLDNAFTKFDEARGLTFEPGTVRPADVDALVSAWLAQSTSPLKEGGVDDPVCLALTVVPYTDFQSDSDVTTYSWTLYNLGTEKCMFNAMLLTYGDDPDFNGDDLVMVIDGEALKPNAGNSVSGSFKVSGSWSDGALNFAAMAVSDRTGAKWLSNTVTFDSTTSFES